MLETAGLSTKFLKKESYSGSYRGMRYTLKKGDEGILVYVYSEPWSFETTPEDERLTKECPYSDDGVNEAVEWLNNLYKEHRKFWDDASKNKMANMLTGKHMSVPK